MRKGAHHDQPRDRNVIDNLSQADRVLVQARVLPDGPLTDEQVGQVRSDISRYMAERGIFAAQVARETGIDAKAVSRFCNGSYDGDAEALARQLNDWSEQHERRRRVELPVDFVPTQLAQDIRAVVYAAMETGSMLAVVAPSGSGKTMIMELLAEELRGPYIYCDEDFTPRTFLVELARAVGAPMKGSRSAAQLKQSIVAKLKGTRRHVFLDEAHRLRPQVIGRIRSLHDLTGTSVVMAGTHEIFDRIDDRAMGRGQMSGRCLRYNALEHTFNAEDPTGARAGRPLFSKAEIRQFFDKMAVRIDPEAFDMLWAIACLPDQSCLRTVRRVVQIITRKFGAEVVTRQDVLDALPLLLGELGHQVARAADIFATATRGQVKAA